MTPDQLTAAGFRPCAHSPGSYWPGDAFAPLYVRELPAEPSLYVHCPLERPEEGISFIGDWSRPQCYWQGTVPNMEQLLLHLDLATSPLRRTP